MSSWLFSAAVSATGGPGTDESDVEVSDSRAPDSRAPEAGDARESDATETDESETGTTATGSFLVTTDNGDRVARLEGPLLVE